MKKHKKFVKSILFILLFLFILFNFSIVSDSNVKEKSEYKIFLNKVLQMNSDAKEYGYNFIEKYPVSKYAPDVLFYLSYIEDDYFRNLINLKKLVLYYKDSKWWEDAIVRLLLFIYIHGNYSEVKKWYEFYNIKSQTFKNRYKVEIIYLKTLYQEAKRYKTGFSKLKKILIENFNSVNNKQLLSYSLYLYSFILYNDENNPIESYKYFLILYSMFNDTVYYENVLYYLFNLSMGQDKVFFAKKLINTKIYPFLKGKKEILSYSKRNYRIEVNPIIDKRFLRDYYFISVGVSKRVDEDLKKIVISNGFKFYEQKIGNVIRFGVGPYHFYSKANLDLEKLRKIGIKGKIVEITYNY